MILLIEFKKVLSQELKCVCSKTTYQSYWNEPYQKLWISVSYVFIALEVNRYTVQKGMYTVQKCTANTVATYSYKSVCPLLIQSYTIQDEMSIP